MSDRLREILDRPDEPTRVEFEYDGAIWVLVGETDANKIADTIMLDKKMSKMYAQNFSAQIPGKKISHKLITQVIAIHKTLQPQDEKPYSMLEIAKLSAKDSGLFFKLAKVAFEVLGLGAFMEDDEDGPVPDILKEPIADISLKS